MVLAFILAITAQASSWPDFSITQLAERTSCLVSGTAISSQSVTLDDGTALLDLTLANTTTIGENCPPPPQSAFHR